MNVYNLTSKERETLGVEKLPISLNEAVRIAKKSDFIKELLGDELKERYLAAKEQEYDEYRKTINQWEIEKYLIEY